MYDELYLAPVPLSEHCAQVGEEDYLRKSTKECRAFVNQLNRQFGEPPAKAYFKVKKCPHDFGTYHDVVIHFDEDDEAATEYAYKVENELPENWDEQALTELKS